MQTSLPDYRSFNNPQTGAVSLNLSTISPPFGRYLPNDFKEIEKMTRTDYLTGLLQHVRRKNVQ